MKKFLLILVVLVIFSVVPPWWMVLLIPGALGHYLILGKLLGAKRWWLPLVVIAIGYNVLAFAAVILGRFF